MKLCLKILAIVATAATTYSLVSCAAPSSFSYQNVTISFIAQCTDCPAGITFNPQYPTTTNNGTESNTSVIPAGAVMTMPNTGEGGTVELLATVTNAPATSLTWQIYPQPNLTGITTLPTGTGDPEGESGSSVGSFVTPGGSNTTATGPNVYYTTGGPPVYSGAALAQANAMGIPQGMFLIVASLPSNPDVPSAVATASLLIQPYGGSTAQGPPSAYLTPHTPTTPAGLVNPVVTVAHNPNLLTTGAIAPGGQYQFYGGIVGAAPCLTTGTCTITPPFTTTPVSFPLFTVDNTAVWEVGPSPFSLTTAFPCSTPGPSCPFGTITQSGLYTAPAAIPSSGLGYSTSPAGEVVVVVVSQLVTTVDSYAYVNIY
jgi:hypothetical protein